MTPPEQLKPYRIEWRADLPSQWVLVTSLDEHPGDLRAFINDAKRKEWRSWGGQFRLITQHVIAVSGLGA